VSGFISSHDAKGGDRWRGVRFAVWIAAGAAFYAACIYYSRVDFGRLVDGLPRLANWAARTLPPDFSELGPLLERAAETVAMATVGVTFGAVIAAFFCIFGSRNLTPSLWLYYPARMTLNALRGVDSFIFALILVAAVGLGPFAGVLGVALHSAGSIAKLWSEAIEAAEPGPLEAAAMSGASRAKIALYALLPDVLPAMTSILLYMWEFYVRASTVLGVVGAGGIGQELKNAVDLLLFDRVFAIILIILAMVTAIDALSSALRRRLI
jgi:phosphonate transport system permease protein